MGTDGTLRRHNGWEIRNADGLYWDGRGAWVPVGMRWCGHSRRSMRRLAKEVGGTLVQMVLVRRTKTGRTVVRCPECASMARGTCTGRLVHDEFTLCPVHDERARA